MKLALSLSLLLAGHHPAHAALRSSSNAASDASTAAGSVPAETAGLHSELAAHPPNAELLPQLFPLLDGDGDGAVSQEDLTAALLLGAAKVWQARLCHKSASCPFAPVGGCGADCSPHCWC